MTLVLCIPHVEGISLISDRQNTFLDGSATTTRKFFCSSDGCVAIGCAGNTRVFNSILYHLGEYTSESSVVSRIPEIFRENYEDFRRTAEVMDISNFTLQLELIIATKSNDTISIESLIYERDNPNLLLERYNTSRCRAIGSEKAVNWLNPQLDRDTRHISVRDALDFGHALISYSARVYPSIGIPEAMGCDAITLKFQGTHEEFRLTPSLDIVERVLYRFGELE